MTDLDDLAKLDANLHVLACWMIRQAYEAWLEDGHERCPEIGLYDFERITAHAETLLPADVTLGEFTAAYVWFEGRADGSEI